MKTLLVVVTLSLAWQQPPIVKEEEVKKAETTLANNPDDGAANLTLGKYFAFQKEEWEKALPHLAKGSDATLKGLAEKEANPPKTGPEQIGLGDDWLNAVKKHPPLRKGLTDRAAFWYSQAWSSVDGPWKDKLRERLRKMYVLVPGAPFAKGTPKEWTNPTPEAKAGVSVAAPKTGRNCFQINCVKVRDENYVPVRQTILVKPGAEYEMSCWVLTDDTESADDMLYAPVFSQDNQLVLHPSVTALPNQPWYKKIEVKFTAPEKAVKMTVQFGVMSKKGTIYVDDISLKQDGKELIKNGSFEQ